MEEKDVSELWKYHTLRKNKNFEILVNWSPFAERSHWVPLTLTLTVRGKGHNVALYPVTIKSFDGATLKKIYSLIGISCKNIDNFLRFALEGKNQKSPCATRRFFFNWTLRLQDPFLGRNRSNSDVINSRFRKLAFQVRLVFSKIPSRRKSEKPDDSTIRFLNFHYNSRKSWKVKMLYLSMMSLCALVFDIMEDAPGLLGSGKRGAVRDKGIPGVSPTFWKVQLLKCLIVITKYNDKSGKIKRFYFRFIYSYLTKIRNLWRPLVY